MANIKCGDRYSAGRNGCRKFPLPVQVLCLNPVFPRVTVRDEVGTRIVGLRAMQACVSSGCIRKIGAIGPVTILQSENKPCSAAEPVLYCSTVGGGQISPVPAQAAKNGQSEEFTAMVTATFVRVHAGRLAQFNVAGVGKVYVTVASFTDKVVPTELDVTALNLREPSPEAGVKPGQEEKAAAMAAKAQEKADKAAARAKAAQEKAAARVAKAQAAADAAVARAAKAAAAATAAPAAQPEL